MEDEEFTPAIKLEDSYDSCLAGVTITRPGEERFVYSMRRLIRFEMFRRQCPASEAREAIADEFIVPLIRDHGDKGPVFLDDEMRDGEISDVEKPLIILPKGFKK